MQEMKRYLTIAILVAALAGTVHADWAMRGCPEWPHMIDDFNWLSQTLNADEREWSEVQRTQIVARCRQVLHYCTIEGNEQPEVVLHACQEALAILMRLKDEAATDLVQRAYSADQRSARRFASIYTKARAPHTIPFLAEFLFLDPEEDKPVRVEDVVFAPRAATAAQTINRILRYSPQFRESVRRDATQFRRRITVEIMRDWWEQNKEHIREGRYDLVSAPIQEKANNEIQPTK